MKNPIKGMKKGLSRMMGGTSKPGYVKDERVELYAELGVIWPDGIPECPNYGVHGQNLARSAILDAWFYTRYEDTCKRAGYALNPGMFGNFPPPIPSGWRPSEGDIKQLFAKRSWNVDFMHYMVAQLKVLGHLRG